MPESPGNIEDIQNSLKASLSRGRDGLDQDVVARSKRVLLQNIAFQPASVPYSLQRDSLRAKYISLNPVPTGVQSWSGSEQNTTKAMATGTVPNSDKNGDSLPSPRIVLYPEERVKMDWTRMTRIGAGLVNMGNTCFFNSTLQCLTYTAPLANYILTNDHREKCKKKDFCMMCEIQQHIKTSLDCGGRSIKPHSILQKLRCIAKHMKWGRQEDAHEFLRFVIDHMQQSCLNGESKLDRFSKETTVVNQIFGGYLRSQVICLQCHGKSNTFDPFMDLSLDIKGVSTVEEALHKFVKPETLDHDNAYKCTKCKNKVRAQKRFSIQKAPNILTLQLNRFDFNRHLSGKIGRFIKYPERINLRNFMSQKQGDPVLYHLYGVLVHSGHSSDHGHYYSFVKSPSKTWYCMNDSTVHQASFSSVLSADAYVLFYARINKTMSNNNTSTTPNNNANHVKNLMPSTNKGFIGPMLPSHLKQEHSNMMNGIHASPSSETGTPIQRQQQGKPGATTSTNGPKIVPHGTLASALPGAHSKISFPILTAQQRKQQHLLQQQKDDGKRIVLQIKHGNSTTMEKSPDGKSKVVNGGLSKTSASAGLTGITGLVPYNDDTDSEQENHSAHSKSSSVSTLLSRTSLQESKPSSLKTSADPHSVKNGKSGHLQQTSTSSTSHPHASLLPRKSDVAISSSKLFSDSTRDFLPSKLSTSSSTSSWVRTHGEAVSGDSAVTSTSVQAAGKPGFVALELPVVSVSSSSSGSKVKATSGSWLVQAQDSAPSPRGSCSSTNSVNSTSEWTVETKAKDNSHTSKAKQLKPHDVDSDFPFSKDSPSLSSSEQRTKDNSPGRTSLKSSTEKPYTNHPCLNNQTIQPNSPAASYKKSSNNGHVTSDREKSTTPVSISDKQPLLRSPSSSLHSEGSSKRLKKHKKKHQRENSREYVELRDDSSSRSDSSSRKKKHKHKERKKRKHKYNSSDSDSDSSPNKRVKHKKQKYSRMDSDSSDSDQDRHKRYRKEDSADSDTYEWVEKTIDSPALKNTASKYKATVQAWNYHVKDDVAPQKSTNSERSKSSWDGSRVSKAAHILEGSSQSWGANVLSWDGSKSVLDSEIEEERSASKRHWSDEYNEDIDAGKMKKLKTSKVDSGFSNSNPFQDHVMGRNQTKHHPSWHQDHSYHQQHDHHYHKRPSHWHGNGDHYNRHSSGYSRQYKHNSNSSY